MDPDDKARERLLEELDEYEWDLSEEVLEEVAEKLKHYFPTLDQAREFVEENASYLFKLAEDEDIV